MNFIEDLRSNIGEEERLLRITVKQITDSLHVMHRLTSHTDDILGREQYCISAAVIELSGEVSESVAAHDVCADEESAVALFCAVSYGDVTPCTLFDVLSDLIG